MKSEKRRGEQEGVGVVREWGKRGGRERESKNK